MLNSCLDVIWRKHYSISHFVATVAYVQQNLHGFALKLSSARRIHKNVLAAGQTKEILRLTFTLSIVVGMCYQF